MKKKSIFILSLFIILFVCGCGKENLKGKTFVNEDLSVYYTDRQGNIVEYTEDNYFDMEMKKQQGYIKTNYYELKYIYSFISNSVVKYEYKRDGSTKKSYNCEYSFEDNSTIKLKCDDYIEILQYNKDNNCLTDEYERKYCIE